MKYILFVALLLSLSFIVYQNKDQVVFRVIGNLISQGEPVNDISKNDNNKSNDNLIKTQKIKDNTLIINDNEVHSIEELNPEDIGLIKSQLSNIDNTNTGVVDNMQIETGIINENIDNNHINNTLLQTINTGTINNQAIQNTTTGLSVDTNKGDGDDLDRLVNELNQDNSVSNNANNNIQNNQTATGIIDNTGTQNIQNTSIVNPNNISNDTGNTDDLQALQDALSQ